MNIPKSAFSLSRDEYGGTGKRLFIGLVAGTALLLCALLLLIWLVPTIGFAAIHPWLPSIAGLIFGGAILAIVWLSLGLVLHAYTGKPVLGTSRLRGITIRLLLPLMELMGRAMRIPVPSVRRSFIKVNNELVLSDHPHCKPHELLVLLPHCIQSSRCTHRLTYHIDHCARCGACPIRDVLGLRDAYGVQVAIATGGTIARRIVVQARPKLIVAVACERDLSSGIQDTHPLPVFGVINERPNGPCLDTFVNIRRLEAAIRTFLGLEADDASGGKGATAPLTPVRGNRVACDARKASKRA
ncbi:DUF116 domain-containing protein [uncultured Bilophila sp.]|uniref:DUF116 domain-containing protein n=1 Tax=uncultured Bilophila sp. TaxID=529385 RepID=UPI0026084587|nr:DUF116 domain-containing protein [uncultured Bilophila sp.]